jgi:type VI secretion system protein ImpK
MKIKAKTHFSDQDYNYARLSVCVWIDEALLNSNWEHKRQWQRELLQRRYHNITDGGLEFFERLDKIGHEDRDVREVAYYCLALGLAGRYVEKGDGAVLDHLKLSNLKRLCGSSAGEPSLDNRILFPEAYQKQAFVPPPKERTWSWRTLPIAMGLVPIVLFVGLMVVYRYLLKVDLGRFAPM